MAVGIQKLTHKQRIEKAHIAIMRNAQTIWLAPVCSTGLVHIAAGVKTAGTDGINVYYDPEFIDKCNDKQVIATVLHENLHKALMHLTSYTYLHDKYDKTHPGIVNKAMDFVVNRMIRRMEPFAQMWDGIIEYCFNPKYDDENVWDTPRVLEDLLKQPQQQGGGGGGDGQDSHMWAEASGMTDEEQAYVSKQIEQALQQGRILARHMSANTPRDIDSLFTPVVDWRQALRDFYTERTRGHQFATYAKPNRRFVGQGIYMPSSYDDRVVSLAFFVDTSGSIQAEDLRLVLSELSGCIETASPETVDIMYWNTEVSRHERYVGADVSQIVSSTKPSGTGGTAPSCVIPFCAARNIRPTVAIWLSDGFVGNDWAEGLGVPAFWVITPGGAAPHHLKHVVLPAR